MSVSTTSKSAAKQDYDVGDGSRTAQHVEDLVLICQKYIENAVKNVSKNDLSELVDIHEKSKRRTLNQYIFNIYQKALQNSSLETDLITRCQLKKKLLITKTEMASFSSLCKESLDHLISSPPTINLKEQYVSNLSDKALVKEFNENATSSIVKQTDVLHRISQLRDKVFPSDQEINDQEISRIRLALLEINRCIDEEIKKQTLETLIEILENDPLTSASTLFLVSLQKKLIEKVKGEELQNLPHELKHLLVKAYALALECILLQMYSPDPKVGVIERSTKEEIWDAIEEQKDFLKMDNEELKENKKKENIDINFWLSYSHQAIQEAKDEEDNLEAGLKRAWKVMKVGFNIARIVQTPENADIELEGAFQNLKEAFSYLGRKHAWFQDLLYIRRISRNKPALFSQLIQQIQIKKDFLTNEKFLTGIVIDLEFIIINQNNTKVHESALKLLVQYVTLPHEIVRERIVQALSTFAQLDEPSKLSNTANILLHLLVAIEWADENYILPLIDNNETLSELFKDMSDKTTKEGEITDHSYYHHVIHFFLKWVGDIRGGGDYGGESFASLLASCKKIDIVEKILFVVANTAPELLNPDEKGKNLFHWCVERGNERLIQFLLSNRLFTNIIDINAKEKLKGDTPLHLAVRLKMHRVVESLIGHKNVDYEKGCYGNMNEVNDSLKTPLHLSVRKKFFENNNILRSLLIKGTKVNKKDDREKTALNIAIEEHNDKAIYDLLVGAEQCESSKKKGPLHRTHGDVKEVLFGISPLIVACRHVNPNNRESEQVLESIIEYDIKQNKKFEPDDGFSIMDILTDGEKITCSNEFALFHCKKFKESKNYQSAFNELADLLEIVVVGGKCEVKTEHTPFLSPRSSNIHSEDHETTTHSSRYNLIRKAGLNINPLMEDIIEEEETQRTKSTKKAIKEYKRLKGSNECNDLGIQNLHLAVLKANCQKVQDLLDSGADTNAVDIMGNTALHFAALYRQNDIIKILLEKMKNWSVKNTHGDTPYLLYCGNIEGRRIDTHYSIMAPEQVAKKGQFDLEVLQSFISPPTGGKGKEKVKKKGHPSTNVIKEKDLEKNNCLHHAILENNIIAVEYLVKNFPKLFWDKNIYGHLPIDCAYMASNKQLVKSLLSHLTPEELINTVEKYDKKHKKQQPLIHILSELDQGELVKKLFSEDSSLSELSDGSQRKETPIHRAIIHGSTQVFKAYLQIAIPAENSGLKSSKIESESKSPSQEACKPSEVKSVPGVVTLVSESTREPILSNSISELSDSEEIAVNPIKKSKNKKLNLNIRDAFGNTFAHLAAYFLKKDILQLLANNHFDFSLTNISGRLPAHLAAMVDDKDVVKLCLEEGDKFSEGCKLATDGNGELPIHIASRFGHLENVKHLKNLFPGSIYMGNDEGNTPAHIAASQGKTDIVSYFIDEKFDIKTPNSFAETPLHLAGQEGRIGTLELLLEKGVNFRVSDFDGENPLHKAVFNHHYEIVKSLLEYSSKRAGPPLIILPDIRKEPPLHELLKKIPISEEEEIAQIEIFELLIQYGASIEQENEYGQNFLHLCCAGGHINILEQLLELKKQYGKKLLFDFNAKDHKKYNCMHHAVESGSKEMVKFLYKKVICHIGAKNADGETPLLLAAKLGKFRICKFIIKLDVPLTTTDKCGKNILHHILSLDYPLSEYGVKLLEKIILKKRQLLLGRDSEKCTPLHILAKKGHDDCLNLLLHNLPKKMKIKEINRYLWDARPGKSPIEMAEEQISGTNRYNELVTKINNYLIADLGKNTHWYPAPSAKENPETPA